MSQSPLSLTRHTTALTGRLRSAVVAASAVTVTMGGIAGAVIVTANSASAAAHHAAAPAALSARWYGSAPYYFAMDSQGPNLATVMKATGEKAFDFAFILASGSSCAPAWEGTDPVSSDTTVSGEISKVRGAGGDVIVSMGGATGTKLGQVCGSASATAAAYQQVISKYKLHAFDFDIEEPEIESSSSVANELGAAQILRKHNPGLFVSVTMPAIATGANYFGGLLLDEAKTLGFTPNDYSIMPFDGGFNGASAQITALTDFHSQLMSTFGWSSGTAYAHTGFSGMNGRTDSDEMFPQSAFQSVLNFANTNHLGRFTFWSVNRDRQCNPPSNNGNLSSECSSVPQKSWAFTRFSVKFAKHA